MKNALIAVLVAAAAALVWIALRGDERGPAAVPPPPQAPDAEAAAQAVTATEAETPGSEAPEPATRHEVEPARAEPAVPLTVTLKGRCVDAATGTPLAGCEVKVHGWGANSERMDAYLKDHAKVQWEDPAAQTTGADGVFAFTFVPPTPYQFTLDVRAPELVRVSGRWGALEPGTVMDFGDVPLGRGSRLSGRVADSDGVPQDGVQVYIDQYDRRGRDEDLGPRHGYSTRSQADGTFVFREAVSAGEWDLRLRGRQKVAPESLTIPEGEAFTTLMIETVPRGDVETITGVVVDEAGAPVRSVHVSYSGRGGGWMVTTGRDGTFVIERRQGDADGPIRLQLDRDGYEFLHSEEGYPWGTADLRFVLKRGLGLDVTVTDRETGEPIEDYGVRCFPEPGTRERMSSRDYEVKNRGRHPEGVTTVEGITRGRSVLLVEPAGDTWETSDLVRFEVTDAGAPPQHVELYRNVTQTLRVQRAGGEPVAGTAVELLRPRGGEPVTLATQAVELHRLMGYIGPDKAVLVMKGETDARGELVLRGPPHPALALRVLGPGHQPLCEPAVKLVAGEPRVLTVASGATVTGSIGPAAFLDAVKGSEPRFGPSVVFRRERQGRREAFPGSGPFDGVRLGEGGAFRATGLPPGTWEAHLTYWIRLGERGGTSGRSVFLQALPGLADGEERELNADLAHLVPGTLAGTVLLDGRPLADTALQLVGRRPDGRGGEERVYGAGATTAADGTFSVQAEPATYRLTVYLKQEGGGTSLPSTEEVALAPRQDSVQVFHVRRGSLRLRVLRGDGGPVAGIEVAVATPDGTWSARTPPTDDDGWTILAAGPPGTVVLTAPPKRLLDPQAQRAFFEANAGVPGAWENAQLQLGRAEISAGETTNEVEVRLPASSEY